MSLKTYLGGHSDKTATGSLMRDHAAVYGRQWPSPVTIITSNQDAPLRDITDVLIRETRTLAQYLAPSPVAYAYPDQMSLVLARLSLLSQSSSIKLALLDRDGEEASISVSVTQLGDKFKLVAQAPLPFHAFTTTLWAEDVFNQSAGFREFCEKTAEIVLETGAAVDRKRRTGSFRPRNGVEM